MCLKVALTRTAFCGVSEAEDIVEFDGAGHGQPRARPVGQAAAAFERLFSRILFFKVRFNFLKQF